MVKQIKDALDRDVFLLRSENEYSIRRKLQAKVERLFKVLRLPPDEEDELLEYVETLVATRAGQQKKSPSSV